MENITEGQYLDALVLIRKYFKQINNEVDVLVSSSVNHGNPILKTRLEYCGFSTRVQSMFNAHSGYKYINGERTYTKAPLQTVDDLVYYNKSHYLKQRNFGNRCMNEILDFMEDNGLKFENN